MLVSIPAHNTNARVLGTKANRRAFPFFKITLPWADKINMDFDMLPNEFLAQEFSRFLSPVRLLWVTDSAKSSN